MEVLVIITRRELKMRAKNVLAEKYWPFFLMGLIPYIGSSVFGFIGLALLINIFFVAPFRAAYSKFLVYNSETDEKTDYNILWKTFKENYVDFLKNTFMRDLFLGLWSLLLCFGIAMVISCVFMIIGMAAAGSGGLVIDGIVVISEADITNMMTEFGFTKEFIDGLFTNTEIFHEVIAAFTIMLYVGFVFTIAGIIVYYNRVYAYLMTDYIIGENPEIRWNEAIKESKAIMKKWKFFAFRLDISFLGWYLLSSLAASLFIVLAGPFSVILVMIGTVIVSTYRDATVTQLYMHLKPSEENGSGYKIITDEGIID